MDLPSFLKNFLELEFHQIHERLLERVAEKYQLDAATLKKEFLEPIAIIPNEGTKIMITRKKNIKNVPPDECRCKARVWNRGLGGRCTRKCKENQPLCTQHLKELDKNIKLRHGYYDDKPPMTIFSGVHKLVYK